MGGRASLACRGRKLRPMPRRRAAQEEAETMIQVRGRGVGDGAGFDTAGHPRPLRSGPHRSGRRGLYVTAAAPTYLRGGEESQSAGLRSGVLAASLVLLGASRRPV